MGYIFIEEDFRARIDNIKEWLGDGVIADNTMMTISRTISRCRRTHYGVGGSYHSA